MKKTWKIGLAGLGHWGPNLLRNLRENPRADVIALCDPQPHRLNKFLDENHRAAGYDNFQNLILCHGLDAVVIATPAGLHYHQVKAALEAGLDVLVEKPLAMTLSEARELEEIARSRGRILMTGHTFLFNPAVRQVKELIEAGEIGNLQMIIAQRLSLGKIRQDCNALWNLAPHDISILNYWIGSPPISVIGRGMAFYKGQHQEDMAFCLLEYPGRVMASLQVSWLNPLKIREMTIVGSKKMLRYDDVKTEAPLTLYDQGVAEIPNQVPEGSLESFRLEIHKGNESPVPVLWEEPLMLEIQHWLESLESRKLQWGGGKEALEVVSVLEACDTSMKHHGKSIEPEKV